LLGPWPVRDRPQEEEEVMVLVATRKVAQWVPIKEPKKDFVRKPFAVSIAPKKAITDFARLKDQRLSWPLDVGSPLTEDNLLNTEQLELIGKMKAGERAVAIRFKPGWEIHGSGFIQPGSRVDVVCNFRTDETQPCIVLQDTLVLALHSQTTRGGGLCIGDYSAILAAQPEEALRLSGLAAQGEFRLLPHLGGDPLRLNHVQMRLLRE
jgi:Flp pilus assembly protein CpaB